MVKSELPIFEPPPPAVAQVKVPAPSVSKTWLGVPSVVGKLKASLKVTTPVPSTLRMSLVSALFLTLN